MGKNIVMIAITQLGMHRAELGWLLFQWAKNQDYDVRYLYPEAKQPLDNARNYWVKRFLELSNHEDDRLLFIDDDIIPPVNVIEQLAAHDKDVVGATCFVIKAQNGEYFPYPVALKYNEENKFIVEYGEGLQRINGTGGGCIMIKRKVLESMVRPYEYKYYPNGELELVADFRFCQKVEENGFEIWYDWNCVCDHIKPVSLKGIQTQMRRIKNG